MLVTDRLHGMVLAHLLGVQCEVMDNRWGKVKSFYDTWYRDEPSVRWSEGNRA